MTKNLPLLCSTILWSSALFAAPAFAQTADPVAETDNTSGDIVVTAQKRPELLSKAPISVSAIGGAELKSQGVVDALSIGNVIPSVQINQSNGLQIAIRGVSSPDGTEKGDPSAAFMLNGVYLARAQSLSGAFFDLQRIEVLRGPQGTLYGRNATAGVVNVIANRPSTASFAAALNGEYSNYDTQRVDGMINVPVSDNLAIRAAAAYNKHDSYLVNAPGDDHKLGFDQDEIAARLSALYTFGEDDQGSFYLVGDYSHQGGTGMMALRIHDFFNDAATSQPRYFSQNSKDRRTVDYPLVSNGWQDNDVYAVTGEFNYDFGGIGVTYLGSYRVFDRNDLHTQAYPNSGAYPDDFVQWHTTSQSHELRVATTGDGPIDAVAGLYYFKEKGSDMKDLLYDFAGYSIYGFLFDSVDSESKAAFGQATWHVTPALRLTGGLRYSEDTKSRVGRTITQTGSHVLSPSSYTVVGVNDASVKFSKVTWKVGADFDVSDKILAYGTVSTGYKAGGFNDGCSASSAICATPTAESRLYYKPEELTAYEVGVKGRYLDNALTLNLSAFYYDYTNLQLNSQQEAPAPAGQVTLNAGKAKIKGVEIEAVAMPTRNDRFDISVALLDAHYAEYFPRLNVDYADKDLDYSPSVVIYMGYTKTVPLNSGASIVANVNSRFSSSYVATDFTRPVQFEQPAYTKTNATLTYNAPDSAWYVQGFVKNIENKVVFSGYRSGRVFASEPRLYGVRAGVKF